MYDPKSAPEDRTKSAKNAPSKAPPGAILASPRDLDRDEERPKMGARFRGVLKGILEGNLVLLRHAKECMTPFNSIGPTFFHNDK